MARIFLILIAFLCLTCSNDDVSAGCVSRLLPNYGFDTGNAINLSLPQYSSLQFAGNSIYLAGYGVKGIYLYNTSGTLSSIIAAEASDPAHAPSQCSKMSRTGIELTCDCNDGNKYQLLTGQQIEGTSGNCLRLYRVENIGNNTIRVFN